MLGSGAAKPRRTHQPSTNARSSSCSDSAISAECGWGLAVLPARARRSTASPVAWSTRSGSLEGIHPRCWRPGLTIAFRDGCWPPGRAATPCAFATPAAASASAALATATATTLSDGWRRSMGSRARYWGSRCVRGRARCGGPVAGTRSPPTIAHPPFRHVPVGIGPPDVPVYPPSPPWLCSAGRRSRGPGRL